VKTFVGWVGLGPEILGWVGLGFEKVTHDQLCDREGPTTKSTEPVTWYCLVMSTGRAQMSSAGNV